MTVESFIIFGCRLSAVNYNQTQTAWEDTVTYHTGASGTLPLHSTSPLVK